MTLNIRPAPPRTVEHIAPIRGAAAKVLAHGIDGLEPESNRFGLVAALCAAGLALIVVGVLAL